MKFESFAEVPKTEGVDRERREKEEESECVLI